VACVAGVWGALVRFIYVGEVVKWYQISNMHLVFFIYFNLFLTIFKI